MKCQWNPEHNRPARQGWKNCQNEAERRRKVFDKTLYLCPSCWNLSVNKPTAERHTDTMLCVGVAPSTAKIFDQKLRAQGYPSRAACLRDLVMDYLERS